MAIPPTTRAALLEAMAEFDRSLRDTDDWSGWQDNLNYEWALVHDDREYPVKEIIHMATGYSKEEFSGGPQANGYVQRYGFEVYPLEHDTSQRETRFWAFFASPDTYRIEEALRNVEEDLWTVKRSKVGAGDRAIIWKGKGREETSGVVALAEVLTDPELLTHVDSPYWTPGSASTEAEPYVRVRYVLPPNVPLWLQEPHDPVLDELTVSRSGGGTVFNVTEDQWNRVIAAAGGWPPAATPTRRNPTWAYDELILALDLYIREGLLDDRHPDVIELSRVLNALPIHTVRPDAEKFRNPNGVALKLANFAALDPDYQGAGMSRGGRRDQEVWSRYAHDPATLATLAANLRAVAAGTIPAPAAPEEDEDEVEEGRIKYRQHRARERNATLINKKKAAVKKKHGKLACEVCTFDFAQTFGTLGDGFIECHHLVPLSASGVTTTTMKDLAVVCSNCHKMLHRAKPWLSIAQLQAIRDEHHDGA